MNTHNGPDTNELGPRLNSWPLPGKILVTIILIMMAIGFAGALGQIIVHDIIPTFYSGAESKDGGAHTDMTEEPQYESGSARGDLFADLSAEEPEKHEPFYKDEQFVWTLSR